MPFKGMVPEPDQFCCCLGDFRGLASAQILLSRPGEPEAQSDDFLRITAVTHSCQMTKAELVPLPEMMTKAFFSLGLMKLRD